jgi:hypothetical protein
MTNNVEKYIAREVTPEELRLKRRVVKDDKYGKMASVLYDCRYADQPTDWNTVIFAGDQKIAFSSFTISRVGYIDVFGNGSSVFFFAIIRPDAMTTETVKGRKSWGIEVLDIKLKSVIPGNFDVNVGSSMFYEVEKPNIQSKFLPGKLADAVKAFTGHQVNAPIRERVEVGHHLTISFPLMTEPYVPEVVVSEAK